MGVVQMVIYLGGALACEYLNDNTANKSLLYLKISSLAILVLRSLCSLSNLVSQFAYSELCFFLDMTHNQYKQGMKR